MRLAYRIIGFAFALILLGYFALFLHDSLDTTALLKLATPSAVLAILVAGALYATIVPISAWAWRALLVASPIDWPVRDLVAIMGATQAAKYVPGNVAQHAGRTGLAIGRGMRWRDFVVSVGMETALAVSAGLLVGLACLYMAPAGRAILPGALADRNLFWLAVLPAGMLLLPLATSIATPFALRLNKAEKYREWSEVVPGWRPQVFALFAYAGNYLLIGIGFLVVARTVAPAMDVGFAGLTAAFALGWLAGFLAPGMPAGLGVRESVMAMMLAWTQAPADVLAIILAMRLATVIGDLFWFVLGTTMLTSNTRSSV